MPSSRTATYCNTTLPLQQTVTHCKTTLQHTATHCNTLQHDATRCITLQHAATHCNTLQHTATYTATPPEKDAISGRNRDHIRRPVRASIRGCNTPQQHTTTHYNILQQHIATTHRNMHCNTLQHTLQHTQKGRSQWQQPCRYKEPTSCVNQKQQHTATTHCNNTLQHTATYTATHPKRTQSAAATETI